MDKIKKYLNTGVSIVIAAILFMFLIESKDEIKRLSNNNSTLQDGLENYKTNDSIKAVRIGVLELKEHEVVQYHSDVMTALKDLNIKFRKLESLSQTKIESRYEITTTFRDSTILDTTRIKIASYKDKWIDFNLVKLNYDDLKININTRDSIIQAVYWERTKKWWFIKYGAKRYYQVIKSANPNSKIKYSKYITPRKR